MDFSAINLKRQRAAERKQKRYDKALTLWLTPKKPKRKKLPVRRATFNLLKRLCKDIVFARAKAKNAGMCEIAMSCGGLKEANTWYHGWPQKGGNGLKYDVRSHFASCSACNMGEYGARMRGDDRYKIRHMELLGSRLYAELNALHGRKPISTFEAREMVRWYQEQLNFLRSAPLPPTKAAKP